MTRETLELIAWSSSFILFFVAFSLYLNWRKKKNPDAFVQHNHPVLWLPWGPLIIIIVLSNLKKIGMISKTVYISFMIFILACSLGCYMYFGLSKKHRCRQCNVELKRDFPFIVIAVIIFVTVMLKVK